MEIREILEQFGLEGKKADVYLSALELGGASVIEISNKSKVKRTTCYDILFELIKEGLILETAKGNKKLFIGEDPEKIAKNLVRKEEKFNEIFSQLKSFNNVRSIKPKIRFYEGVKGIREVYLDTLKYSDEFLAFGSEDILKTVGNEWMEDFIRRRIRKGIRVRAILPMTEYTREKLLYRDEKQLRSVKLIEAKNFPFTIEVDIYGESKISFISAKEQLAVIIESFEIFNTIKSIFELLWDNLPEVKVTKF